MSFFFHSLVMVVLSLSTSAGEFHFNVTPSGARSRAVKAIVVKEHDGVVDVDLKGAFASGAKSVSVQREFPSDAFVGMPFAIRSRWSSVHEKKAAKATFRLGAPYPEKGRGWWVQSAMPPPNQKRADPFFLPRDPMWVSLVGVLPDFAKTVTLTVDVREPGDGVLRFHAAECGGPELLRKDVEPEGRSGTVSFFLRAKDEVPTANAAPAAEAAAADDLLSGALTL